MGGALRPIWPNRESGQAVAEGVAASTTAIVIEHIAVEHLTKHDPGRATCRTADEPGDDGAACRTNRTGNQINHRASLAAGEGHDECAGRAGGCPNCTTYPASVVPDLNAKGLALGARPDDVGRTCAGTGEFVKTETIRLRPAGLVLFTEWLKRPTVMHVKRPPCESCWRICRNRLTTLGQRETRWQMRRDIQSGRLEASPKLLRSDASRKKLR